MAARFASKSKKRIWRALEREGRAEVCHYCGTHIARGLPDGHPNLATLDHVIPRSRGGGNHIPNIVASCFECNNERGDKALPLILYKEGARGESPFWRLRQT